MIVSVAIYMMSDSPKAASALEVANQTQAKLAGYALKSDVDQMREVLMNLNLRAATIADECRGLVNDRVKNSETDIQMLKSQMDGFRNEARTAKEVAKVTRQVIHKHEYSPPTMQVQIMDAPKAKPTPISKGKGRGALFERERQ